MASKMSGETIRQDVQQKLLKIIEGKTFSDRYTIISEAFQNCQRAKSSRVDVSVSLQDGLIEFHDDGVGISGPKDILTLDYSSWKTTDEGFGIGFWSCVAVNNATRVEVVSNKWKIEILIDMIKTSKNPEDWTVTTVLDEEVPGFAMRVFSTDISNDYYDITSKVRSVGELMPFYVFLNNDLIPRRNLLEEVSGDFTMEFHNHLFDAKFSPNRWGYPMMYYENREVVKSYDVEGMNGVILLRKNALTLKEPDRKEVIYDEKRNKFVKTLKDCEKEFFVELVKTQSTGIVDKYADQISSILEVKDYMKFLELDDVEDELTEEKRDIWDLSETVEKRSAFESLMEYLKKFNSESQLSLLEDGQSELDESNVKRLLNNIGRSNGKVWVKSGVSYDTDSWTVTELSEDILLNSERIVIGGVVYEKTDAEPANVQCKDSDSTRSIILPSKKRVIKRNNIGDTLKKHRRKAWVKASEADENKELIAQAEYYGVKVFVSKNRLFDKVFQEKGVPYITEMKDNVSQRSVLDNVGARAGKEESFIEMLKPLERYFDLPEGTFQICNIKLIIETKLDGVVIDREVKKNTKGFAQVPGCTDREYIYLDRNALDLSRFHFGTGTKDIGKGGYKAMLSSILTIAHELAHYKYNTVDNTIEHYKKQDELFCEIEKFYNSL